MAHKYGLSFVWKVCLAVGWLLLFSLATSGAALAQNPVPLINQPLVPDAVEPGGAGFILTVNGSGFASGAAVYWNGSERTTSFVSGSRLNASILDSDVAKPGTASVTVVNPGPGGGSSNVVFFDVTTASSSLALSAPTNLSLGSASGALGAVGDLNGDGKLDLIVANQNYPNGGISVLLGNGDGTFRPHVDYATGRASISVALGDFNRDGKVDLVVTNEGEDTVSVLLGNGDGTFRTPLTYTVGNSPYAVAVGDFNRDGKLDFAVTNRYDNDVSVMLGNGDGTFQPAVNYSAGAQPISIAVGDVNGDGKLDLVTSNFSSNDVSVLLGNGDGTFRAAANYATGSGSGSVVLADFNGDGKLDVTTANGYGGDVSVLLGNGDGTFQAAVNYAVGQGPEDMVMVAADFNGDGKLDLVTSNFSVLLGNGDGTFEPHLDYGFVDQPHSILAGDFNCDGRIDVAVPAINGVVGILLQTPSVSLAETGLTYAGQLVGTTSPAQIVNLTNGGLTSDISSITITGLDPSDFKQTNTCPSAVAPGASCTISVEFKPTQAGPRTAAVTISDNAAGSPQQIALTGTGVAPGPNATLSNTSLTYATQLVHTPSSAQSVTLTADGAVTLNITRIGVVGTNPSDFAQTNNCGGALAPGASCTITVIFTPTQSGSRTAILSISDNASGSPQTVSLSGTGTVVQLNPVSLNFGTVTINQSRTLVATLTNLGGTMLNISGVGIIGTDADEFRQGNNCISTLKPGASCSITVIFRPTDFGADSASISISDTGGGSPQQLQLHGYGWAMLR